MRKTGAARAKGAPKPRIVVHDHFERVRRLYRPALECSFNSDAQATTAFLADHSASQDHCEVVTASSPGGVAKLCSTVFTMLPSSPQVQEVYLEEMGILQAIADRRDEPTLCVGALPLALFMSRCHRATHRLHDARPGGSKGSSYGDTGRRRRHA